MLAAAALALALAGQALAAVAAPDLFPDWRTLCVQHRGDLAGSIAQADGLGWQVAPPEMMKALPATLQGAQGRYMFDGSSVEFVLTGRGDFPVGPRTVHADVCMVGARPADATALVIKAGGFAGVPAAKSSADQTVFAFSGEGAGRRAVDVQDEAASLQAIRSGGTTVVLVQSFQGGAMLAYAVPTL